MKNSKINFLFLVYTFFFVHVTLPAQHSKGLSLESTLHFGKIFKHHDFLNYEVPPLSIAADINLLFQTKGSQPWHELHDYPLFGIGLLYYDFGDPDVLGTAWSVCPNLAIYLARAQRLDVIGQIGVGPAWLSKPYDRLNNPGNNAIGSNLNLNFYFRFFAKYHFSPHWALSSGISFTHYSNGASAVPNYGINIPALTLGTEFTPEPLRKEDYISHGNCKKPDRRFGLNLHMGAALKEINVVGGPSYPIYSLTAAGMYYLNKTNRASLGIEHEINKAAYYYGIHLHLYNSETEAIKRSNRFMLFIADEFLFGQIGLMIQMGIYLTKYPVLTPYPVYNKWGFHYHFSKIGKTNAQPYIGTHIKTHLHVADYISLDFGVAF